MARFFWLALALTLVVCTVVCTVVFGTATASAHGGAPQVQQILFHPSDDDRIVANATFGLLVTEDGGATWDWVCVQAIPSGRLGFVDPGALLADGSVFLAQRDGLRRGALYGCAYAAVPPMLDGAYVADVVRADSGALFALQSDSAITNAVYTSTDGAAFSPLGARFPSGFLPERIRVAASDARVMYVSGAHPPAGGLPSAWSVFASDDGGASWDEHAFAMEDGELSLFLLEVDASTPTRLHAWVRGETTDRLIASDDSGETFTDVDVLGADPVPNGRPFGFAVAPDGTRYYGNTNQGLYRALPDGAIEIVDRMLRVSCLAAHDEMLYVCADGRADADGFAIAKTPFDAIALDPVLTYDEVTGVRACAAPSDIPGGCAEWWNDFRRDVGLLSRDGGVAMEEDGGTTGSDGGSSADGGVGARMDAAADAGGPPPSGGGCGVCTIVGPRSGGLGRLALFALFALSLLPLRTRRRKR